MNKNNLRITRGALLALLVVGASMLALGPAQATRSPPTCTLNQASVAIGLTPDTIKSGDTVLYAVIVQNTITNGCDWLGTNVTFSPPAADGNPGTALTLATGVNLPNNQSPDSGVCFYAPGAQSLCGTLTTQISNANLNQTVIVNSDVTAATAAAASTCFGCVQTGTVNSSGNAAVTNSVAVINPNTTLTKTANVTIGLAPLTVLYTYNETNNGIEPPGTNLADLSNVFVTDDTCVSPSFVSGDTNSDGILNVGETWTFTCTQTYATPGIFTNTANASGSLSSLLPPNLANLQITYPAYPSEQAKATVTVISPGINLTKTPNVEKTDNVTAVTYTYVVGNNGTEVLTNVVVTDNIFGSIGGPITLNPGDSQTFTKTTTLTSNTTNIATATGNYTSGSVSGQVTATATAFVRVINPSISVNKSCAPKNQTAPGTITWTIVTTNTGDATLSNVTLLDSDSTVGTIVIGTLAPGESNTTTVTETNLAAGSYSNTVTATGDDQLGTPVSATSQDTCTVIPPPPTPALGRITGGGSVFYNVSDGTQVEVRVTKGYELHCNASKLPNNFEVNWNKSKFHLENLTNAICVNDTSFSPKPPRAPFDTYYGNGTGRLDGVPGATAAWKLTDKGEPGKNDTVAIQIWDVNGTLVLNVPENLVHNGNNQAHAGDP